MRERRVEAEGLTIALYESEGSGQPALLLHGNSASAKSYGPQLDGPLGAAFRLVAIDLPGHGLSAAASDPASTYTLPGYASVVLAAVEQLGLHDATFVGWSLGGNILLEASDRLPRAAGIMLIGTQPLGIPPAFSEAFHPNPALAFNFQAVLSEADAEAFARALLRPGAEAIPETYLADIRRADPLARQTIGASLQAGAYRDEVAIVAGLARPLAVVYGEHDQIANPAYARGLSIARLWRGAVQTVRGAGHIPNFERPVDFDPLLAAFIEASAA